MFLLDTQLVLWSAFEPSRLSSKALRILQDRKQPLAFSMASLWEVAIKTSLGKPGFQVEVGELHAALTAEGFDEVTLRPEHLVRLAKLPWLHRDPFDRLLVSQAAVDKLTLLTADATLKGYGRFVRLV